MLHRGQSSLEQAASAVLDQAGIPYIRELVIGGKFPVDFYVPGYKLILQFDGDYWHANPRLYSAPTEQQRAKRQRDSAQDAYFHAAGFKVVRLWESDFYADQAAAVARIRAAMQRCAPRNRGRRQLAIAFE